MKRFYALTIALLIASVAFSQSDDPCESCLPDGITFTTQTQIDSFQINFPNCTEIEGEVILGTETGLNDFTNLNGLNAVTRINEGFTVAYTNSLVNFQGLENLKYIGGNFIINHPTMGGNPSNLALTNFNGLEGLDSIAGFFGIHYNTALISLSGLDNLVYIGGNLFIEFNDELTNLSGLNLQYTGGIDIYWNENLETLIGLESLTEINGDFRINRNNSLISLTGANNIHSITGTLNLGQFDGEGNTSLQNLTGLENLEYIGQSLFLNGNLSLVSLSGIDNLTSIGDMLKIGDNPLLSSLTGLNNLINISGDLGVYRNDTLTSLFGLDNINAGSIMDLTIIQNPILSTCAIQSICDYLVNPNGEVNIHGNAQGCSNTEEVQDSCDAHAGIIDEQLITNELSIYPNPSHSTIAIELSSQPSKNISLTIFNTQGQQLITQVITEPKTEINISALPASCSSA